MDRQIQAVEAVRWPYHLTKLTVKGNSGQLQHISVIVTRSRQRLQISHAAYSAQVSEVSDPFIRGKS